MHTTDKMERQQETNNDTFVFSGNTSFPFRKGTERSKGTTKANSLVRRMRRCLMARKEENARLKRDLNMSETENARLKRDLATARAEISRLAEEVANIDMAAIIGLHEKILADKAKAELDTNPRPRIWRWKM